jgi:hypothetical protein
MQAVAEEFFVLATRESHTRRLQQLEASMQQSLHVMRLSEAELAAMYGLDSSKAGHVQVCKQCCWWQLRTSFECSAAVGHASFCLGTDWRYAASCELVCWQVNLFVLEAFD